jgi:hypothetical protein
MAAMAHFFLSAEVARADWCWTVRGLSACLESKFHTTVLRCLRPYVARKCGSPILAMATFHRR